MMRVLGLAGLLLASGLTPTNVQAAAPAAAQSSADARLKALYNGYSTWDARESQYFLDSRGEIKPTASLPHVDAASQERRAEHLRQRREIGRDEMPPRLDREQALGRIEAQRPVAAAHRRQQELVDELMQRLP